MKTLKQILNDKAIQQLISIAPENTVLDALKLMAEHRIGALAVIQGDQLVGIFSERDYARDVALQGRSSKTTLISEVMTTKLIIGAPTDPLDKAMSMMSDKRIRHLPVIEDGRMLGMLSLGDLVKETIVYQQNLINELERYIRGG